MLIYLKNNYIMADLFFFLELIFSGKMLSVFHLETPNLD